MKYAAFYGRFSCEKQNEQSIDGQLRVCEQYAVQNGLTIVETYIDRATTGTNDNRPAFRQMLADCAKPVVWDVVLVYALDRFGRNSVEIAVNKQKLKKHKKILISATQRTSENLDGTKNLDGILLENVYIGLAEYYSAELSQKTMRGMKENRLKGLFCGGAIPYGYKVVDKRIQINEEEAEVVRYIFREYASGKFAKDIIRELTERGILRRGKPFAMQSFYNMLRYEYYIGIYRHNDEVYTNTYPPIVSKEIFEQVGEILSRNKHGSHNQGVSFLLREKLFCGLCGQRMYGESGTSKSGKVMYYYKCSTKKHGFPCDNIIPQKEAIEKMVLDRTVEVLGDRKNLALIAEAVMTVHEQRQHDDTVMTLLMRERDEIQTALDNVMKAIESGIWTATTKSRMEELELRREEIKQKILTEENKERTRLTREEVIEYLYHATRKEPALLINLLIDKILLFPDRIEIYYKYTQFPPKSPQTDHNTALSIPCSSASKSRSPPKTLTLFERVFF